jgi:hypothetical protein
VGDDGATGANDAGRASDQGPEAAPGASREPGGDGAAGKGPEESFDFKGIVRQLTAPMIESLDTRLRDQIEAHVDELLTEKLDAALADRFLTVDRAIADLSRSIAAIEQRLRGEDVRDELSETDQSDL